MYASLNSCSFLGVESLPVSVEVRLGRGIPMINIVGMGDKAVKEAAVRIRSGLNAQGMDFPQVRVDINLAPADVGKRGSHFDLPMALGIALAQLNSREKISIKLDEWAFFGELSLDGKLNPVKGVLPMIIDLPKVGIDKIVVPINNMKEATCVKGLTVFGAKNLGQVYGHIIGQKQMECQLYECFNSFNELANKISDLDYNQVEGQEIAKRAMIIAAAGNHDVFMSGPPGSGKTMLARRLPTIMGDMTYDEMVEVTKIYSVAGLLGNNNLQKTVFSDGIISQRPFRNPSSNITKVGLIGGGIEPKPGELSLASNGCLFLDEVTIMKPGVLDAIREPLEDRNVRIIRKGKVILYPADTLVVMAANLCKCGRWNGRDDSGCICSPYERRKYSQAISGAVRDRIDMHINLEKVAFTTLMDSDFHSNISSAQMKKIVEEAKEIQYYRFGNTKGRYNGQMNNEQVKKYCALDEKTKAFLEVAYRKFNLTARSYYKVLKVARTIADIEASSDVKINHIAEACQYRYKEF